MENIVASPKHWQVELYRPYLRTLARGLRIDPRLPFDASDLVQDTVIRALKGLEQFHGEKEPELLGWLQAIMANTLADKVAAGHAKKRDVVREHSIHAAVAHSSARLENFLAASQPSPSQEAERNEMLLRLTRAIEELPEDQQTAVVQRKLQGASMEEIAETMGRTEKAVAGLLHRGMLKLRELLQEPE
jgi:RNA polymerase sigma-70 factor, ECF subfamily